MEVRTVVIARVSRKPNGILLKRTDSYDFYATCPRSEWERMWIYATVHIRH